MSQLMNAINGNDIGQVKQLINEGVDVNQLEPNGDAPLIMAAYKGHSEIVNILLQAGADTTVVDPGMKATALHAAAYAGRTEAAQLLINYGIDINAQTPEEIAVSIVAELIDVRAPKKKKKKFIV